MKKFKISLYNLITLIAIVICISCCLCTHDAKSYNNNVRTAITTHQSVLTTPGGSRIGIYKVLVDNESYIVVYDSRALAITKQ